MTSPLQAANPNPNRMILSMTGGNEKEKHCPCDFMGQQQTPIVGVTNYELPCTR
jgi:hypothetical protein